MEKEKRGVISKIETTTEKAGGALATILGAIHLNAPVIGLGILAFLVGSRFDSK